MRLEFIDVPSDGAARLDVPAHWVGTTVTVRVHAGRDPLVYALGVQPGVGRHIAHGIFQPWTDRAVVVVRGTAYVFREEEGGEVSVSAVKAFPVSEAIEAAGAVALITPHVIVVQLADGHARVVAEAVDGFRNVRLNGTQLEGEAWGAGEWQPFRTELG